MAKEHAQLETEREAERDKEAAVGAKVGERGKSVGKMSTCLETMTAASFELQEEAEMLRSVNSLLDQSNKDLHKRNMRAVGSSLMP